MELDDQQLAKFAGVIGRVWADPGSAKRYKADPHAVLAEHGIHLPAGVPAPVVPEHPAGTNFSQWGRELSFEGWDVKVKHYPNPEHNSPLRIATLACVACPYSCFSSISE
jgi:hypothetical protein